MDNTILSPLVAVYSSILTVAGVALIYIGMKVSQSPFLGAKIGYAYVSRKLWREANITSGVCMLIIASTALLLHYLAKVDAITAMFISALSIVATLFGFAEYLSRRAETELLARQFADAGYRLVSPSDGADVYILNTCTVTHIADRKSRHLLRMAHCRNPDALVVATGCYAERACQELARIKGVGPVLGNNEKPYLLQLLEESGHINRPDPATNSSQACRTRTFIKVQDGCNNFCAYCIVPIVRGREKSLPVDQVVAEVRQRCNEGYREVVLTGTEIGSHRYKSANLAQLVEHISKLCHCA